MFTAKINNQEVFSHKSESHVREFARNYLKSEEHLGEIIQIFKNNIPNVIVFSSKKRTSGKISMIDITNEYKNSNNPQIIKDQPKSISTNSEIKLKENIENSNTNIIGNAKYPRWEVYWKDADGCRIPKSTIVSLEWFTMNYDDPKEKQWMDEHGYTPEILNNILAIPVNSEKNYENLSDEWGTVQKIKRLQ